MIRCQIHPGVLRAGDPVAIQVAVALIKALTVPQWPVLSPAAKAQTTKQGCAIVIQEGLQNRQHQGIGLSRRVIDFALKESGQSP